MATDVAQISGYSESVVMAVRVCCVRRGWRPAQLRGSSNDGAPVSGCGRLGGRRQHVCRKDHVRRALEALRCGPSLMWVAMQHPTPICCQYVCTRWQPYCSCVLCGMYVDGWPAWSQRCLAHLHFTTDMTPVSSAAAAHQRASHWCGCTHRF